MSRKGSLQRFLAYLLAIGMALSLLPMSALAEDGKQKVYQVNISIMAMPDGLTLLTNVTMTLTGSEGTYHTEQEQVGYWGSISVLNVPKGNYDIQITGTGSNGVSYKHIGKLTEGFFKDDKTVVDAPSVSSWTKDVNDMVTLSFSFTDPKPAQNGQQYSFQNITGYLIAAADYQSAADGKRYPLAADQTGYMSAQVPANQEYKLIAEGWTYMPIDGGTKDLTVKHSFEEQVWTISCAYTDKDNRLSLKIGEEKVAEQSVEGNWIEVPVKIEDKGTAEHYTVSIKEEPSGRVYSSKTTNRETVIRIPALSNESYSYTITVEASDGRSITKDRYFSSSFYKTTMNGKEYTATARGSENPIVVELSDNYVTTVVNVYGNGQLVASKSEKQALDNIFIASEAGVKDNIAVLKKGELFVDDKKVAESDKGHFNNLSQYQITANSIVRADFYYEYTDIETEYKATIHHRFVDAAGKTVKDEVTEEKYYAGDALNILKQTEYGENWISQATKQIENYRQAGAWRISAIEVSGGHEGLKGTVSICKEQGIVDAVMPHDNINVIFTYRYIDNYIEYRANANDATGEMYIDWGDVNETKTVKAINSGKDNYYSRSGYNFVSWNTKADGSGITYKPGETITLSGSVPVTLYAQWSRIYYPPVTPPTVEIPDEDALGLNTDDHFAYIIGYPDGTVQPNGQITRAEATTIFFRLLTDESRENFWSTDNGYPDVSAGQWYNNAISTMTKAGIVDGYPDGTFRPDAPITRAEMAKIISLFAKLDKSESRFSDIAGHWAERYIKLAAGNGWIEGYPDGTFGPQRNITRAETATMINRVLERVPSEESRLLSRDAMQIWPDSNPGDWFYLAMQEASNSHDYERNAKWAAADEQWTALCANRDWKMLEK